MHRPRKNGYDTRATQRVAYLRGTFGMTMEEIVDTLGGAAHGVNLSQVNRLLKCARTRGLLTERTVHQFTAHGLSDDELAEIKDVHAWDTLRKRLGGIRAPNGVSVRGVRAFVSGRGTTELRLRRFGMKAAGALAEMLPQSSTFAVTWGTSIGHVIDALGARMPDRLDHPIRFVPVRAARLGERDQRTSSSSLAMRLDEIVNGVAREGDDDREPPLSLNGVSPFTPHWFRDDPRFREFLHELPAFSEIFGLTAQDRRLGTQVETSADPPLIARVDALLTSIGPRNRPAGEFYGQLRKHGQIGTQDLFRIVLGDIGGVLLPVALASREDLVRVAALNEISTGLQREHLEDIAVRAQERDTPGVIVASLGDKGGERALTLLGAIRAGLVNELIIDRQLADSLMALLDGDGDQAGRGDA